MHLGTARIESDKAPCFSIIKDNWIEISLIYLPVQWWTFDCLITFRNTSPRHPPVSYKGWCTYVPDNLASSSRPNEVCKSRHFGSDNGLRPNWLPIRLMGTYFSEALNQNTTFNQKNAFENAPPPPPPTHTHTHTHYTHTLILNRHACDF